MENVLKTLLLCLISTLWVCIVGYIIVYPPPNFSVWNMLMLMPPWCRLQPYSGVLEFKLKGEASLAMCVLALVLFWLTLYFNLADDVTKTAEDAQKAKMNFEAERQKADETQEVLIENAEWLLSNLDVEYQHCAATIAANNETPGQLVGGEVEWATGETSSEDEDATREVKGACIRNKLDENANNGETKGILQEKSENKIKAVHSIVLEPNVTALVNNTEAQNIEGE